MRAQRRTQFLVNQDTLSVNIFVQSLLDKEDRKKIRNKWYFRLYENKVFSYIVLTIKILSIFVDKVKIFWL